MPKTKTDPLLSALIAKLPDSGADWPVEKQLGWLKLMAMAFETIYGGNASEQLNKAGAGDAQQPKRAAPPAPSPPKAPPKYPFIIDEQGFVRRGTGDKARVRPDQVTDTIYDLRGIDGDIGTMVWADGSSGINGRDLTIAVG